MQELEQFFQATNALEKERVGILGLAWPQSRRQDDQEAISIADWQARRCHERNIPLCARRRASGPSSLARLAARYAGASI
jgi:hypothetical protein